MKNFILFSIFIFPYLAASAEEGAKIPEGRIISPYEACKNTLIVYKDKYHLNKTSWDQIEKTCRLKIQLADDVGLTSLDPLKEGVQYLEFSQRVAKRVIETLEKNRLYAECSARCFSGQPTCPSSMSINQKIVKCDERKREVLAGLTVNARKIRMELALSNDAPGIVNINIRNVLTVGKNKLINTDLRDFEAGTPNPVGRTSLTERELIEAHRRVDLERKKLEDEFKEKGLKNYGDWMSVKLMQKYEEHQERYRSLVFEEAPIFAVIDRPDTFEYGSEPRWKDSQIAKAFKTLSENAINTQKKVHESLDRGKLEFRRDTGAALAKWLAGEKDLLFYMGMKNQVEDVLKDDPASCGIATAMEKRLETKLEQNTALSLAASFAATPLLRGASYTATNLFRIGRALTGTEAAGVTGIALGGISLNDSFKKYDNNTIEAATRSGIDNEQEGRPIISAKSVEATRSTFKTNLIFAPFAVIPTEILLGKGSVFSKKIESADRYPLLNSTLETDRNLLRPDYVRTRTTDGEYRRLLEEWKPGSETANKYAAGVAMKELEDMGMKNPSFIITPDNLPTSNLFSEIALKNPKMPEYLKKMKEKGFSLIVDPSLGVESDAISILGRFSPSRRSIRILPNTTWDTFMHEYQHLEFFNLGLRSGHVFKTTNLTKEEVKMIKETKSLIKKGFSNETIDETLAVKKEISTLEKMGYSPWSMPVYKARKYAWEFQEKDIANGAKVAAGTAAIIKFKKVALNPYVVRSVLGISGGAIYYNEKENSLIVVDENGKSSKYEIKQE